MLRNIHEASRFLSIARYSKGNILLMIAKKKKKKKRPRAGNFGAPCLGCFFLCSAASLWSANRERRANFVRFEQGECCEQNTCQYRRS